MNEPNLNLSQKKQSLTQQVFHPGLFNRPRSSSLSELGQHKKTSSVITKIVDEQQPKDNPQPPIPTNKPPDWQRVPESRNSKKRKMSVSPPPSDKITTSNQFEILSTDTNADNEKSKTVSKPPPLILYGIEDINKLKELIETTLNKKEYVIKIINKNQLRVGCETPEAYKMLMTLVREHGLVGHTFTRKEERCYRIVIRNLHHTSPHSAIIEEIEKTGNKVQGEIINARVGPDKTPTSTFFVNIERGPNNKEVKSIRYIYNTVVKIEDPRKSKTVVQCTKCQQYGHTKNNCLRPFRCVKCAEAHKTSECPKKDRSSPAKCALCFGSHPANYKGCEVYQEIAKRKFNNRRQHVNNKPIITPSASVTLPREENNAPYNIEDNTNRVDKNNMSYNTQKKIEKPTLNRKEYAEVLKTNQQHNKYVEPPQVVFDLLIKQSEKIDMLLQQLSTLMGLIGTLVAKLSK